MPTRCSTRCRRHGSRHVIRLRPTEPARTPLTMRAPARRPPTDLSPDAALCPDDLRQRIPAVPGATHRREADPAVVRRLGRGMGDAASSSSRPRCCSVTRTPISRCAGYPPRTQVKLHVALLVVSLVALPIVPGAFWKPEGSENPVWLILGLLGGTIGLPYFLLSTTSPLVQAWFARRFPGRNPYRLFALSNLASLLALLGYPFLLEPWVATRVQAWGWSAGYALFVGLAAAAAFASLKGGSTQRRSTGDVAMCRRRRRRNVSDAAAADARAPDAVVRAGGHRLGAAARGDQSHHAERRGRAVAVDRSAVALSADLHSLLRRQGLVQARHHPRDAGRGARRDGVDARRSHLTHESADPDRRVLRRSVPRLHVLPRRARAAQARACATSRGST